MFRVLLILLCCAASTAARADSCPGNPDALATERVLAVDARISARVGRKQFPDTPPLAPKEVILTFNDGPWPTTPAALDALRGECVPALDCLNFRGIVIFGTDLWASDWNPTETAATPPELLKELKNQGYRVVHVVPAGCSPRPARHKPTAKPLSFFGKARSSMEKYSKRNVRASASLYSFRLTFGS